MSDDDLNTLVEMGKEDVLQFVKKNLFSEVSRNDGEGNSIYTSFFLAMKKQKAGLDVARTREILIQENEKFLSGVGSNDPYLVYAMAQAAGRVSQMQECLMAVERLKVTHEAGDDVMAAQIDNLKSFLLALEKTCVKLGHGAEGGYELLPLSAVFGTEKAAGTACGCSTH